jgi:hypothetical protein
MDISVMDNVDYRIASISSSGMMLSQTGGSYTATEDIPLTIFATKGVVSNSSDSTDSTLHVTSLATMDSYYGGEVKLAADGGFRYTPPVNFTGQDYFQYTLSGASVHTSKKAVVTVTAVNDTPVAANDLYGTLAGEKLMVGAARGVLANDREVEDQSLKVVAQNNSRLRLNADGSFAYSPAAGFTGKERFNYVVSDGVNSAKAVLTFAVGHNRAPIVHQDSYHATAGQAAHFKATQGLLINDRDPEGKTLSISATGVFDTLFGGEVNIGPEGGFTYLSPPNFDGFDSFTYSVTDGAHSVTGCAVISVSP